MGKCLSGKLQKLQNRAGGLITYSDYSIRSADILNTLGWDTLEQKRTKQLAISVFKSWSRILPRTHNPIRQNDDRKIK